MRNHTFLTLAAALSLGATAASADPQADASIAIGEQGRAAMVSIQAEIADGIGRDATDRLAGATRPTGATLHVGATRPVATLAPPAALEDRGL